MVSVETEKTLLITGTNKTTKSKNVPAMNAPILYLFDKNPILNKNASTGEQISPIYTYAPVDGLSQDYYHTLKLKQAVSQPYIVFEVPFTVGNEIGITEFQLFEAVGKEVKDGAIITSTAEESNLYLISHLT